MFQRPPRLSLINLDYTPGAVDDADTVLEYGARPNQIDAQFNPEELTLATASVYKDQTILGMSHTLKQFSNTKNLTLSFDLHFQVHDPLTDFAMTPEGTKRPVGVSDHFPRLSIRERTRIEGFLLALCVPQGVETIARNRPPMVLVVWPQCLTFAGIVDTVSLKYTRFNMEGAPVAFTASISMEEIRDLRYTSDDARMMGLSRRRG